MHIGNKHIHLDFHNHESIASIAEKFDPDEFARFMKRTGVDAVNVFAKCTHGMSYYPTRVGVQHPGLGGRDLLGEMIEALHAQGLRAPVYYCVGWEERLARLRPEWRQVRRNGVSGRTLSETAEMNPDAPGTWHYMDFNNPEYFEHIRSELLEIAERYPVDGWWLDILHYHPEAGYSDFNVTFRKARGIFEFTPTNQRRFEALAKDIFGERIRNEVMVKTPRASVFFNANHPPYIESEANPRRLIGHATHWEIESLASGLWGYHHFPRAARLAATTNKPWYCMTGRFYRMWGDFGGIKHDRALEYEVFRAQALGAGVSIGDQLHPAGQVSEPEYEPIRKVLSAYDAAAPLYEGVKPAFDVGVFYATSMHHDDRIQKHATAAEEGCLLLLDELRFQPAMLDDQSLLHDLKLVIVPEHSLLSQETRRTLGQYYDSGGRVLIVGNGGGHTDEDPVLPGLPFLVSDREWHAPSYALHETGTEELAAGYPYAMYLPGWELTFTGKRPQSLMTRIPPLFRRTDAHYSSHYQAPPSDLPAETPAVMVGDRWAYISYPIFEGYREFGYWAHKEIVRETIKALGVVPWVSDTLPTGAKVFVSKGIDSLVVTVLNYSMTRKAIRMDTITDALSYQDCRISLDRSLCNCPAKAMMMIDERRIEAKLDSEGSALLPDGKGRAVLRFSKC